MTLTTGTRQLPNSVSRKDSRQRQHQSLIVFKHPHLETVRAYAWHALHGTIEAPEAINPEITVWGSPEERRVSATRSLP